MPINIQNIVNQINTRLGSVDSNTSTSEIIRLSNLAERAAASPGLLEYQFPNQLPTIDSANVGSLAYIRETDFYLDSAGQLNGHYPKYFFAKNDSDGWIEIELETLDNADSDNFAYINRSPSYTFQGSVSGYSSGGDTLNEIDTIEKFSFASDGNATSVGVLTEAKQLGAGQSSSENGYNSGGMHIAPGPQVIRTSVIEKFPFASDGDGVDVGDLTTAKQRVTGQNNGEYGYTSGGFNNVPEVVNEIEKFSFASDGNATDVGDLTLARSGTGGQSSTVSGYNSGGISPSWVNTLDKFSFASDAIATDVGDIHPSGFASQAGQSSTISGYASGGNSALGPAPTQNVINKFPFASDTNGTDIGDLAEEKSQGAGHSSTTSGYLSGGLSNSTSVLIQKFPFASDDNATDIGDLSPKSNDVGGNVGTQV